MTEEITHISSGFLAHVLGGLIGSLVGWCAHLFYERRRRKKSHAQFDRDILEFAQSIRGKLNAEQIPTVMKQVVPLASRARFRVDMPPLKEGIVLPSGTKLHCKICLRDIEPTVEGRCDNCKLGCSSYHEPAKDQD